MIELKERTSMGYAIGDKVRLHNIPEEMKAFLNDMPDYEDNIFEIINIKWMTVEEDDNGPYVANILHLIDIHGDKNEVWAIEQEYVKEKVIC